MPFLLNKFNILAPVIPDLIRNPDQQQPWIPASAGMTKCEGFFLETALGTKNAKKKTRSIHRIYYSPSNL